MGSSSKIEQLKRYWKALRGDGCTSSPDFFYSDCCRNHDADYEYHIDETGKDITRLQADNRLFDCMKKKGKTPIIGKFILPVVYWSAVRLFGKSHWKD